MTYRPTLNFIAGMLIVLCLAGMIWGSIGLLNTVQLWAMDEQAEVLLTPTHRQKFYHPTYTTRKEVTHATD